MADRIEREIEEILAKLEDQPAKEPAAPPPRTPVSMKAARRRRRLDGLGSRLRRVDLPLLMFAGAGVMIVGFVLSAFTGALIWVAFAGVVMFVAAFVLSFLRGWPRPGRAQSAVYWRDRYIQYGTQKAGPWERFKRRLRR